MILQALLTLLNSKASSGNLSFLRATLFLVVMTISLVGLMKLRQLHLYSVKGGMAPLSFLGELSGYNHLRTVL